MEGNERKEHSGGGGGVVHRHSDIYNIFILGMTVFSLLVTIGLFIFPSHLTILRIIDFLVCMVFLVDFLISLWRAPQRGDFFFRRRGWMDLLGAIPIVRDMRWVALFRLARLNRFVRIIRHLRGREPEQVLAETRQNPEKAAVFTMLIVAFVMITISSFLILVFENRAPGASIKSGEDAIWWSFVTIATVGYGDYVPVTILGRVLAVVLMIFGISIFAILTSFVRTTIVHLQGESSQLLDENDIGAMIREETALIRAELAELKAALKAAEKGEENKE